MKHTGASLVDAFRFASLNPATALGLTDRGEIAVGKRANLIFVDRKMYVQKVLLGGKVKEVKSCSGDYAGSRAARARVLHKLFTCVFQQAHLY